MLPPCTGRIAKLLHKKPWFSVWGGESLQAGCNFFRGLKFSKATKTVVRLTKECALQFNVYQRFSRQIKACCWKSDTSKASGLDPGGSSIHFLDRSRENSKLHTKNRHTFLYKSHVKKFTVKSRKNISRRGLVEVLAWSPCTVLKVSIYPVGLICNQASLLWN